MEICNYFPVTGPGGYSGLKMMGMLYEGFFGFEIHNFGIFLVRKFRLVYLG